MKRILNVSLISWECCFRPPMHAAPVTLPFGGAQTDRKEYSAGLQHPSQGQCDYIQSSSISNAPIRNTFDNASFPDGQAQEREQSLRSHHRRPGE
jgi:hypothetical protein